VLKCALQTPTTGQVVECCFGGTKWGLQGEAIIVTLLWSEIMGDYNTPDTMVEIGVYK